LRRPIEAIEERSGRASSARSSRAWDAPLRLGRPWECAAAESFGVHLRNLLGFLYPDPDPKALRDGDVIAGDYIATPIGDQSATEVSQQFRGFLRDVAKPDLAERFRAELDALGLSFEQ
jgi:hypothetical protein